MTHLTDYHIHTKWCHHAVGEMEDYVKHAIALEMEEIGFADHAPGDPDYDPKHRMDIVQFGHYIKSVQQLNHQFDAISVKLGIETDFYPHFEPALESMIEQFPLDYVIGSVHYVDNILVFNADEFIHDSAEQQRYTEGYFTTLRQGLESGLVQVVGHIDVMKYPFPHLKPLIEDRVSELLPLIADQGLILELNTSGWRRKPRESYPSVSILKEAARYSIPICLNSDAHQPDHVGCEFDRALQMLTETGYRQTQIQSCGIKAYVQ